MQQRNPWDNDAVVPTGGGMVITKAADPGRQYEGPTKAAQLDHIRLENARLARDAAQTGDGGEGALDPATRTYYAQQVLAGAPMPSLGMGKQAAAAKQAIMAEVARLGGASGLNGADQAAQLAHYKAGSGQIANLEKMAGTIGVNEQTALANGQQFLDRSRELPGQTRFQPLNAISDFIQRKAGGTTISAADAAYNTFVNEYAKVVAGSPSGAGVMSDSARHEAMSTISGSGSIEQKQAAFNQMKADMANRMNAIHGGINSAYKALTQQPGFQVPDSTQGLMAPGAASGAGGGGMPPSGGDRGVSSGGPASGLSVVGNNTGGSTIDPDRQRVGDKITSMMRDGVPDAQVLAFAKGSGYAGTAELSRIESNLAFRAAHPNALINYVTDPALKSKDGPQSIFDKYGPSGTGAFSTYAMNAASALSGNMLDNMTADPALARAGLAGASAANPKASLLGEITGAGLAAAGTELGVGAVAGRAGLAASPWVARGADALYGGLSGAGAADDGSRAGGALLGAGAGLVGGMVGRGVLAPIVSRVARPITSRFGSAAAPQALSPAESALANRARQIGPSTITSQLEEAQRLGVPMSLADTGAPLTSLAGAAVRRSPEASQIAQDAFLPRARGQIDRLGQAVETNLGPVGNIPQTSADLLTQAKTAAAPLYDAAYSAPGAGAVHPHIADYLQRPSMRGALSRARRIAAEEGRDPSSLGFDLDAEGNTVLSKVPSWQTLDYAKRGLDDTLEAYRDKTTGRLVLDEEGRAIDNTRRQFLKTVDNYNPAYGEARGAYAGPVQARDDLQAGYDAFSANPNQLGLNVTNATPAAIPQMQLGYRGALMDKANSVRTSTNPFDATLGTPAAEQRLGMMFQGSPGVAPLLRTRDLEGQLARTNNSVLGNSMTAQRQIADSDFAANPMVEGGLHAAAAFATGGASIPGSAARLAGIGLKDRIALGLGQRASNKANALAPVLFDTNPASAAQHLSGLLSKDDAYRAYINNLPGRRISGMFAAGLGLLPFAGQ